MHEIGVAEGILAVAVGVAAGERVERVRVRVGALHRVTVDSLRFCFELTARETLAAEAVIEVDEVAVRVRCRRCAVESTLDGETIACRACDALDVEVIAGAELVVDAVKVASGWRHRPGAARPAAEVT